MFSSRCRFSRLLLGMFAVVLLVGMLAAAAVAQSVTGSISGTVTDSAGGVIVGASVTLRSDQTGSTRTATTSEDGRFSFAALQPGVYTIKVEQSGFQSLERKNAILTANESLALGDLSLTAGQVSETVTVTGEGATVEKESSDLTARLTSDQIELISTKGRDITSLLRLLPGTSNDDDIEAVGEGFGTNLPNISGQRGRSTVTTVDGLNASEPSGSNKISMTTSQDAIGEVKVLRNNYAAEYGNNGGAIINIVSKGGTKDYRGSAYYFIRNEGLNANSFFNNKAGLKRGLYRHNIPGGNFSGPLPLPRFGEGGSRLLRNKAFFFINVEKPHTITPTNAVFVTVPTALERQGDFSKSYTGFDSKTGLPTPVSLNDPPHATGGAIVGNVIPSDRWNANGLALLNFFPLPNTPFGRTQSGGAYNYVFQQSVDVPKHSYLIRFDVKPTNNDSVYWKYQWWTSDNVGLGTSGWPSGDANRWGINSHYLYTDNGWSANWVHVLSSTVVNEFNFGMRRDTEGFIPADGMIDKVSRAKVGYTAAQLFPQNNNLGAIPRITNFGNVAGTPANINWLDRWGEVGQDYIRPSFADNLSVTRGDHSYKFGVYFERLINTEAPGANWTGTFNFSNNTNNSQFTTAAGNANYGYANLLLGNFQSYSESSARPHTNLVIKQFQWYGQDQWRANRRLTINYGMRFTYHSPFVQSDGLASNFDPTHFDPANAPLLYVGFCKGGTPAFGTACATANQFAVDPRNLPNPTSAQLLNRNLVRSFVPGTGSLTNGLVLGTDPTTPPGFRKTKPIDFEPRVGFAWDVLGNSKTILRMHGGVYHAPRVGGGTTGGNLVNNPPQSRTFTINTAVGVVGNIDNLANIKDLAVNFPGSLNAIEVNSKTPTIYNFQIGVQRDIGFKTVMEVSYVGSLSRHLGERRNINQVPDGARFVDPAQCALFGVTCHPENRDPLTDRSVKNSDFLRPYRGYGDINMVMYSGSSNYNSLQVQVNRRYTSGFQYGVAYTYSKSFDYANDDSSDVNNGRPYKAFNRGPSDFDQTHILTVNYIYDVPRLSSRWNNAFTRAIFDNWQISGTTSFATGKPKDFTLDSNTYSGTTFDILRASGTCPPLTVRTQNAQARAGDPLTDRCNPITDWTGGTINATPFVICDPMKSPHDRNNDGTPLAFNPACFAQPTALGQIGNLPRNILRRPSIFNTDLAFFKNIRLGEKRSIQLRWETYNLFNRSNFSDIDATPKWGLVGENQSIFTRADGTTLTTFKGGHYEQTNARFGAVSAARSPRVMQASIRINF
jgi:hypothetical protein